MHLYGDPAYARNSDTICEGGRRGSERRREQESIRHPELGVR